MSAIVTLNVSAWQPILGNFAFLGLLKTEGVTGGTTFWACQENIARISGRNQPPSKGMEYSINSSWLVHLKRLLYAYCPIVHTSGQA